MSFILLGILNSQASAGGGGAFDLLETTVLGTAAATVTFSSLGSYSNYKHLQIRAVVRSTRVDNFSAMRIRLNNDTGNNYSYHVLAGDGTSVTSGQNTSTNNIWNMAFPAANQTANKFVPFVMDLLDFSNTSKNTTARTLEHQSTASATDRIRLASGAWLNTAAVTEIDIEEQNANFAVGSRFSLYGIK